MVNDETAECPFCLIIAGKAPGVIEARSWVQGEEIVLLRRSNPLAKGPLLAIPRRHVANACVDPVLTGVVMTFAVDWAGASGGSWNFITSVGAPATQVIMHLHLHLVPRRPKDGLRLPW